MKGIVDTMIIGERIKLQREKNKMSREQLAALLNVDCDYVVNLEDNNKEPSFEDLPKLANLLKCSIDYLISGKESDLTIETMDSSKRIQYFLDHDDAEGFIKYNYAQAKYIFSSHNLSNSKISDRGTTLLVRNRIYNEKLINIFNVCLDKFIENKWIQQYGLVSRTKPIDAILENIDDYILMCCYANRIDGLEYIDFKKRNAPVVPNKDKKTFVYVGDGALYYDYSFMTLEKIYNDLSVSKAIKDYVFEVLFLKYNHRLDKPTIFTCFDSITYIYYKNKDFKTLNKLLEEATNYYKNNGFDGVNFYWFNSVIKSAILDLNVEWIKKVNDFKKIFNLAYKNYYDNLGEWTRYNGKFFGKDSLRPKNEILDIIDDEKMKYYSIKSNPKSKPEEILKLDFSHDLLLDVKLLLKYNYEKAIDANTTKEAINSLETTILKTLSISPIYIYEYFLMCLDKKDFAELQKLFVNGNSYYKKALQPLIEEQKYKELKETMRGILPINIVSQLYNYINTGEMPPNLDKEERGLLLQHKRLIPYKLKNVFQIKEKTIALQFENIPINVEISANPSLKDFKEIKKKIVEDAKQTLLEKLESFTHHNELVERFTKTNEKYSSDKLLKYISLGEEDIAIVNLCSKLEIFVKAYYELDGDFKDVLDQFIDIEHLNEDESALLNKIRIKRNSIVHAENSSIELNADDLTKAIILVEKLIKQEISK